VKHTKKVKKKTTLLEEIKMTNGKNFTITLEGKEGSFRKELRMTMHHEHETLVTVKEQLSELKKAIVKMVKEGQVMITVMETNRVTYQSFDKFRYIFDGWIYNGVVTVDLRTYNGRDYGDKQDFNFITMAQLYKFVMNHIEKQALKALDEIPSEGKGWYAQSLEDKRYDSIEN
jgi:hypothetical protein